MLDLFFFHSDAIEQTTTGRSTPTVVAPKKESSGVPYRSTRFGFRKANLVRPSSTGLPLKVTHFDNITNNNNNINDSNTTVGVNVKQRSKSAVCTNRNALPASTGLVRQHTTLNQPVSVRATTAVSPQARKIGAKIDSEPVRRVATTTTTTIISGSNNNTNNNNNNNNHAAPKKITFDLSSNTSGSGLNINRSSNVKHSYAVISTELHTNEM